MIDLYLKYIHPKEIRKDINYYFDKLKDLIINDIFSSYILNKRKGNDISIYIIEDFLSKINKTKLKFLNDKIKINIIETNNKKWTTDKYPLIRITNKLSFKDVYINSVNMEIDLLLNLDELKNKIIYVNNPTFIDLRKKIKELNDFYVSEYKKRELLNYNKINGLLKNLNRVHYFEWNKLVNFLIDCTDPEYNDNLNKIKILIDSFKIKTLEMKFKMVHNTKFYRKYNHYNQLKTEKFIKNLIKNCLDENEIITMTNNLSSCFGHKVHTIDDSLIFIENIINHFNKECNFRENQINLMIT